MIRSIYPSCLRALECTHLARADLDIDDVDVVAHYGQALAWLELRQLGNVRLAHIADRAGELARRRLVQAERNLGHTVLEDIATVLALQERQRVLINSDQADPILARNLGDGRGEPGQRLNLCHVAELVDRE